MTAAATTSLADLQAELLAKLCRDGADRALLTELVRVLGDAQQQGHVCVDLRAWCDEPVLHANDGDAAATRPPLDDVRARLLATGVVGTPEDGASPREPLVLDDDDRLYARRHFDAERRIAAFVTERLRQPPLADGATLKATLERLELHPDDGRPDEVDWQLAAVVAAAARSLTVLCGGPGTGKTTTVAKLLSVLLHDAPELRIAICAPTGKAAARLGEALQQRSDERPELADALRGLEPKTLHRLLAYLPFDDTFRFGHDRKLPYDLVVVDEVSMVDPAMLAQLCDALHADARLVLVGDKDQLASVAGGQVLSDLCEAARPERGVGPQLAELVAASTGMRPAAQQGAAPIADATVALWKNHRFGTQPGIGAFAAALMHRRPDEALHSLRAGHDDLVPFADADEALAAIETHLLQLLDAATSGDPQTALAAIRHARVLTAQRLGPFGATTWNARVEARLQALGHRTDDDYYLGRPILITSNDHQSRIWNGDLGVVGRDDEGRPVVWLADQDGRPRKVSPRRLPAHETAWAMTVHKAQGSEFDTVLLVLPDQPGPLLNASLVYTGVTRARRRAMVLADLDVLAPALARWPQRRSGLAASLR